MGGAGELEDAEETESTHAGIEARKSSAAAWRVLPSVKGLL